MVDVTLDERSALDPAFAGNLLLATFAEEVRNLIEPHAEVVELESGTRVQSQGTDVEVTYFPYATSMISLIVELPSGRSIEVASIGREGAVGGIVSCGHAPAFAHAIVPEVHKTTASDCVKDMAKELGGRAVTAREERMRRAGAYDPVI